MKSTSQKTLIVLATMLGAFWAPLIFTSINVALPTIGKEFGASPAILSWVISSTLLATAMLVIPVGKFSDMFGRKKTLFLGSVILTVSSFLCGTANSVALLIVYRSLQGIGSAMLATTVVSIVSSAFAPGERGKALGINVACTYIGLSVGPFIGGLIVQNFHWRGIFFFSVPFGLLLMILTARIKQEWKEDNNKGLDYKGSILYAAAIFAMIWGLSNFNNSSEGKIVLVCGVVLIGIFAIYQLRTDAPLLDLRAMKSNKVLVFSSIAALINYSSTFAISYMMSLFLQSVKGISPQSAGLVLLIQPTFQAFFSPVAGNLSDRMDPQRVSSVGMALIAVSLACLSFIHGLTPIYLIMMLLSVIGIGFAMFSSPNTNSVMSSVEKSQYGVVSGILSTARTVGQSFSMAMTALITSIYLGSKTITPETAGLFVQSFKVTFLLFAVLCLLGVGASLARGKREVAAVEKAAQ